MRNGATFLMILAVIGCSQMCNAETPIFNTSDNPFTPGAKNGRRAGILVRRGTMLI